jgi:hypothetical protein
MLLVAEDVVVNDDAVLEIPVSSLASKEVEILNFLSAFVS